MTKTPFTDYNSNQRVVAIPVVPSFQGTFVVTGAVTANQVVMPLSAANLAAGSVNLFLYWVTMAPDLTAAASGLGINLLWQFQNAAHAAVGSVSGIVSGFPSSGGAAAGSTFPFIFTPSFPQHYTLPIPASAVEVAFQTSGFNIVGAPVIRGAYAVGLDPLNGGTPGDIGGGGMTAQSATNPNTF